MKSIQSQLIAALFMATLTAPLAGDYSFKRGAKSVIDYMQTQEVLLAA